jgi:hypothetical protein
MASQLSTTAHPLRTPCVYPRSLHENRLLHHLLAKTEKLILLTPVIPSSMIDSLNPRLATAIATQDVADGSSMPLKMAA